MDKNRLAALYEINFADTGTIPLLQVFVNKQGHIELAEAYSPVELSWIDVTENITNSKFWTNRVSERFQHIQESLKEENDRLDYDWL